MNFSSTSPAFHRDRALEYIHRGREIYTSNQNLTHKEKGFEIFKKGIELLLKYAKTESDADESKKIRLNIKNCIDEAEKMKSFLQNAGEKSSTVNSNKFNAFLQASTRGSSDSPTLKQREQTNKANEEILRFNMEIDRLRVDPKNEIKFSDIIGMEHAKQVLSESIIFPLKFPELFQGFRRSQTVLLYGPPGVGKTQLARACAAEVGCSFYMVNSSDFISKWCGESEKFIRHLFRVAKNNRPSIIFLDEIDSLSNRDHESEGFRRIKTELLVQLSDYQDARPEVSVIAATNIPWRLDNALRRRLHQRIYIPLPNQSIREKLIRKLLETIPNRLDDDEFYYLANQTEGFSCSDLSYYVRDVSYFWIKESISTKSFKIIDYLPNGDPIYQPCLRTDLDRIEKDISDIKSNQILLPKLKLDDFEKVLSKTKPSVQIEDIKKYEEFRREYDE